MYSYFPYHLGASHVRSFYGAGARTLDVKART